MKTTRYFESVVRVNHPEVQMEWIEQVLANPVKTEVQGNGRIKYLGKHLRIRWTGAQGHYRE